MSGAAKQKHLHEDEINLQSYETPTQTLFFFFYSLILSLKKKSRLSSLPPKRRPDDNPCSGDVTILELRLRFRELLNTAFDCELAVHYTLPC